MVQETIRVLTVDLMVIGKKNFITIYLLLRYENFFW